jgi:transposase-like protein
MSRKRTIYSAEFKAKVVLEILESEKSLNEITGSFLLKQNRIC